MIENQFNVSVGIIIQTTVDPKVITEIMEIQPSKIIQNGKGLVAVPKQDCSALWIFLEHFGGQNNVDGCVDQFFERIPNFKEKICKVNHHGTSKLRISLVSEYGQIGFGLSSNNIQLLSDMDMLLEVSIFSYGMCIDE